MNWINPRTELPKPGQTIWCLQDAKNIFLNGNVFLAYVTQDEFGGIKASRLNAFGQISQQEYYFLNWKYEFTSSFQYEKLTRKPRTLLTAWAPFESKPNWQPLSLEESKEIMKAKPEYKRQYQLSGSLAEASKATAKQPYFVHWKDAMPPAGGLYVVATKTNVFLLRFEKMDGKKWWAPNGEEVLAWYPVPESY